jgi:hypothetical protein
VRRNLLDVTNKLCQKKCILNHSITGSPKFVQYMWAKMTLGFMSTAVECLSVGTFCHHNDFEDPTLTPSSWFGFSPLVCSCTGPISIIYATITKLIYNSEACFGPKNIQLRSITPKPVSALLLSCYEAWFRPWAVKSHVPFLFIHERRKWGPTLFQSPRNYLIKVF